MKPLPLLVPDGCALSADELVVQAGRAARLRPAVTELATSADELRVSFGASADEALVDELVATERGCCGFLTLDYDRGARLLRVGAADDQGREVVRRLAGFFEGGR